MNKSGNSQPLLEPSSDNENVYEDDIHDRLISGAGLSDDNNDNNPDNSEMTTDEFEDDSQNLFKVTNTIPNDKCNFTYMVFYLLGMTTLLPWNFFVTAEDVSCIALYEDENQKKIISAINKFASNINSYFKL